MMPEGVGEGRRGVEFLLSLQLTEVFFSVGGIGWIIIILCGVECSEWPGFML